MSWWNPFGSSGNTTTPTITTVPAREIRDNAGVLVDYVPETKIAKNSRDEIIGKVNESGAIEYTKSATSDTYIPVRKPIEPKKVEYRDMSGNVVIGDDGKPIMVDDDTEIVYDDEGNPVTQYEKDPIADYDKNYDYQALIDSPEFADMPPEKRDAILAMREKQIKDGFSDTANQNLLNEQARIAAAEAAKKAELQQLAQNANNKVRENLNDVIVRLQSTVFPEEMVTFNVMPVIEESRQVNYSDVDLVHGIGGMVKWKNTSARSWKMSELTLISRTREEATRNLQRLLMIRSWTMPVFRYGTQKSYGNLLGAPPPVLYFTAYSDLIANIMKGERIPVVLSNYSWSFPIDCDWVPVLPTTANGASFTGNAFSLGLLSPGENGQDEDARMNDLTNIIDFYDPRSKAGFPITGGTPFPMIMKINLELKEAYSPQEISNFDLAAYREGMLTEAFGQTPRFIGGLSITPKRDQEIIKLRKEMKDLELAVGQANQDAFDRNAETLEAINNMEGEKLIAGTTGSQEDIDARNESREQKKKEAQERIDKQKEKDKEKADEDAARQRVVNGKGSWWENVSRNSDTGQSRFRW